MEPPAFEAVFCPEALLNELLEEVENEEEPPKEIYCDHLGRNGSGASLSDIVPAAGAAGVAGVAVPILANAALSTVGITANGIAAGSIAAAVESALGEVTTGPILSSLQAVGATGGFSIWGPLGLGAAAIIGGGVLVAKTIKRRRENAKKELESRKRLAEGIAEMGVDLCRRCWIKMKLRLRKQRIRK